MGLYSFEFKYVFFRSSANYERNQYKYQKIIGTHYYNDI